MQPGPAEEDLVRTTPFETPRRGDQRWIFDAACLSEPLEPAHKVEILKQRYRAKPGDSLVDRAAHEDSRVAVIEPNEPYQSAKSRKPSAEGRITVENESKIPTNDLWIRREHIANLVQCSGQQSAVGVQEQQYFATRFLRANTDRSPATGGETTVCTL